MPKAFAMPNTTDAEYAQTMGEEESLREDESRILTQTPEDLERSAQLNRQIAALEYQIEALQTQSGVDLEEIREAHDLRRRAVIKAEDWKWRAIQAEARIHKVNRRARSLEAFAKSHWTTRMLGYAFQK